MSKNQEYLSITKALCDSCKKSLPMTGEYVKCLNCGGKYHYSPCATVSESTYSIMSADRKATWKCHICRGEKSRSKSPNNLYQEVIHEEQQNQQQPQANKQQRNDDDNDAHPDESNNKRFKDSINLNTLNSSLNELKFDVTAIKTSTTNELTSINANINTLNNNIIASNNAIREEMANAFLKLTEAISTLTTQVNDLKQESESKEIRIRTLENKVNSMEQQLLNKNIEIKNIKHNNMEPSQVIKTIAASVNVNITDSDISNAYKIKNYEKIIVEFSSLNKKKELMSKINKHRVSGTLFKNNIDGQQKSDDINNSNNTIYINDQLTAHNRRLLWQAKSKAKELGWKFVWVREGNIFAKKNENSSPILIRNTCDIELIA